MNSSDIPHGYCHCGCGNKTKISNWTNAGRGYFKGQPYKYLMGHASKKPLADAFWANIAKTDGCWEWQGYRGTGGYGQMTYNCKSLRTHRVSWELHFGPIPKGIMVLHKCDNPACCNPDHLFLGTQSDNMQDCVAKNRHNKKHGDESPRAKLSSAVVIEMRKIRKETGLQFYKIAQQFNIPTYTAFNAITGRSWNHLKEHMCTESMRSGENHRRAKLKNSDVLEMRRIRCETGATYLRLAAMFGVSPATANKAVTGKLWKDIGGEDDNGE